MYNKSNFHILLPRGFLNTCNIPLNIFIIILVNLNSVILTRMKDLESILSAVGSLVGGKGG